MGKIDIDYQKFYDVFFRWQIKFKMIIYGDFYYEVCMYFFDDVDILQILRC